MLLTILIFALSTVSAPLAAGRPTATNPSPFPSDARHLSVEPGTLLGRRYVVQEHHEPSRVPRAAYAGYKGYAGYAGYGGYAPPTPYRTAEAPRHSKPFAQFLLERSRTQSRRADHSGPLVKWSPNNYVSHVGPPPPHMQAVQPAGASESKPFANAEARPAGPVPATNPAPSQMAVLASNSTSSATSASQTPKKTKGKSKWKATHEGGK